MDVFSKQSPIKYILGFCGVIALIAIGIILFVYGEEEVAGEKVTDPNKMATAICNCIEQLQNNTPLKIDDNECYQQHKETENELEAGVPIEKYNAALSGCMKKMQPSMSAVELAKWEMPNLIVDENSPLTTNRITQIQKIGGTAVASMFLDYYCEKKPKYRHEVKKNRIKIRLLEPDSEDKTLCTKKIRWSRRMQNIPPGSYLIELYHWNHDLPVDRDELLMDLK